MRALYFLGVGVALGGCGETHDDGTSSAKACSELSSWEQKGVDAAALFTGTGAGQITYPDGTQVAVGRELRCEVLRDAYGKVVGYGAAFADSLPRIGYRAALLVASGYAGDGVYHSQGEGGSASVQLVVWIADEPCQLSGGCWSGTYPAQVTLEHDAHLGVATTAEGLRLDFECSPEADLAPVRGEAISNTTPAPGFAYMERTSGIVVQFVGVECSTDEATGLLSVRTQPSPWTDSNSYDRGYGFSMEYLQAATTTSAQRPLAVHLKYDYFGTMVGGAPVNATLNCGSPFAGAIENINSLEDPNLVGVWFQCP